MIDQYIQQLASEDPVNRRQAILALGRAGDARSLGALEQIYRHDPDPVIRELALRAGRRIRGLQSQGGTWEGASNVASATPTPTTELPVKPSTGPLVTESHAEAVRPPTGPLNGLQPASTPTKPPTGPLATVQSAAPAKPPTGPLSAIAPIKPPPVPIKPRTGPLATVPESLIPSKLATGTGPLATAQSSAVPSSPGTGPLAVQQTPQDPPANQFAELPVINIFAGMTPEQEKKVRKVPSGVDKRLAKGKLDSAIGLTVQGDKDRALSELIEAIRLDPGLANETLALNLAATLTGITSTQSAMAVVIARIGLEDDKRATGQQRQIGGFSFDSGVVVLGIEIVLLCLVMFLFSNVLKYGLINVISQMSQLSVMRGRATPQDFAGLRTSLQSVNAGLLLRNGILSSVSTLLGIGVTYVVGIFLGGSGEFIRFVNVLLRINIITSFLATLSLGILFFGAMGTSSTAMLTTLLIVSAGLGGLAVIGGFGWSVVMVGRLHEVGFLQGVLIVLAGDIALNVLSSVFGLFS